MRSRFLRPHPVTVAGGALGEYAPLLVHHGVDDRLVTPTHSDYLKSQLESAGKKQGRDFRIETYTGQGHGFTGEALTKSRAATVEFLAETL